jgi:hypothetical protein
VPQSFHLVSETDTVSGVLCVFRPPEKCSQSETQNATRASRFLDVVRYEIF